MRRPVPRVLGLLAGLALLAGGCGNALDGGVSADGGRQLTVLAAASTTEAFERLAEGFEERNRGVDVRLSLAGSQQLASQVLAGVPADVFASANPGQMQRVASEGLVAGDPAVFARNEMAVAVPADNPGNVRRLADLAEDRLVLVLAAEEVPAGEYARQVLAGAGVQVRPDSLEPDVRQVLTKVALGEADAAIVYASDLATAGPEVARIAIPPAHNVVAEYPIAVLDVPGADDPPPAARAFVDYVRSPAGRRILTDAGFHAP